jgi:hypothetical protein
METHRQRKIAAGTKINTGYFTTGKRDVLQTGSNKFNER